jgi:hypothetical protein
MLQILKKSYKLLIYGGTAEFLVAKTKTLYVNILKSIEALHQHQIANEICFSLVKEVPEFKTGILII